jgi:tryptophan 2,3-dioxygenase
VAEADRSRAEARAPADRADRLVEVHKILSRVSRIQSCMTLSWDVLATLTPTDYVQFRGVLGGSSGFQSAQFARSNICSA